MNSFCAELWIVIVDCGFGCSKWLCACAIAYRSNEAKALRKPENSVSVAT